MFLHRSKSLVQKGGRLSSPTEQKVFSTQSRVLRVPPVDIAKRRVGEAMASQYAPAAGYRKDAFEARYFGDIFSLNDFVGGLAPTQKENSQHKLSNSVWLTFAASEYALTGGMISPWERGLSFNGSSSDHGCASFHERVQVAPHEIYKYYTTIIFYRITLELLTKYDDLVVPVGFAKNLAYILNGKGDTVKTGKGGAFQTYINNPELLDDLGKCARVCFTATEKESYRLYVLKGVIGKKQSVVKREGGNCILMGKPSSACV